MFSPDSNHFAYAVVAGSRRLIVQDGTEMSGHAEIAPMPLTFSPSSDRLAYVAGSGGRQFAVIDWGQLAAHDGVEVFRPSFSDDSRHVAYVAKDAGIYKLCVDSDVCAIEPPQLGARLVWDDSDHLHTITFDDRVVKCQRFEV